MHKQCSTFKNVLNLRYLFFVMYLIFPKIKVMIIFKHLFVISIPSKTLATSSQYVRKLAIFALITAWRGISMVKLLVLLIQINLILISYVAWLNAYCPKTNMFLAVINNRSKIVKGLLFFVISFLKKKCIRLILINHHTL